MRILIEPLLFGDYAVAIYDNENNLVLDRKYYCAGYFSAWATTVDLKSRDEWKDLLVYIYDLEKDEEKLLED